VISKSLLQQDFPNVYCKDLYASFENHGNLLFPTYLALDKRVAEPRDQTLELKHKNQIKMQEKFTHLKLDETIRTCKDEGEKEALEEFRAARNARIFMVAKSSVDRQERAREAEEFEAAKRDGTVASCGCCYDDFAMSRMVQCNGEDVHVQLFSPLHPSPSRGVPGIC